jgi:hypothetical protein
MDCVHTFSFPQVSVFLFYAKGFKWCRRALKMGLLPTIEVLTAITDNLRYFRRYRDGRLGSARLGSGYGSADLHKAL